MIKIKKLPNSDKLSIFRIKYLIIKYLNLISKNYTKKSSYQSDCNQIQNQIKLIFYSRNKKILIKILIIIYKKYTLLKKEIKCYLKMWNKDITQSFSQKSN
jgi:hypothetical protein